MSEKEMVVMGRIVAPYGVLGWVKVVPDTEVFDGLRQFKTWWLGKGEPWQTYTLDKLKIHNDVLVVKLSEVDDRDAALALKGQQVAVPKTALPTPDEDEYYWSDLIGLQVQNTQGLHFGRIADVFDTGANDVIVVKPNKKDNDDTSIQQPQEVKERLIPFVGDVIQKVDLEQQLMLVDWDESY